ncbi:WRKY transcription factor 28-like [Canna indica]|uniref:WRKY transcription factor 28-like n=1 Tax=Canna indica TaxID=4628 RepID=A0AAQ3L2J1_9LILI|nr:WRKY transcription factor 28-like [Canna indica]
MNGDRERYHHHHDLRHFLFHDELSPLFSQKPAVDVGVANAGDDMHGGFNPEAAALPLLGFNELLQSSMMDYGLLGKGLEVTADSGSSLNTHSGGGGGVLTTVLTPNSSISPSLAEAAGAEGDADQQQKEQQAAEGDEIVLGDKSKTANMIKAKKKGEKRKMEPRYAFMTKSDVENLEDGYRWRKYGQKAVKNSPYPRNYYRCTTQKCLVKKRVERSYEDPKIVVTTYEGKHTHQIPATTIRGRTQVLLSPPPLPAPTSIYHEFMMQQVPHPHIPSSRSSSSQQHIMIPNTMINLPPPLHYYFHDHYD